MDIIYYIQNCNDTVENFPRLFSQYINVKNCFELVKNTGIPYDFVVKTRPDLFYNIDPSDIFNDDCIKSSLIYTSNSHHICDYFAVSTLEKMEKYCNTIDKLTGCYEWCSPDVEITPHMLLHYSLGGRYTSHLNINKYKP